MFGSPSPRIWATSLLRARIASTARSQGRKTVYNDELVARGEVREVRRVMGLVEGSYGWREIFEIGDRLGLVMLVFEGADRVDCALTEPQNGL